jgi:hypothetical protein
MTAALAWLGIAGIVWLIITLLLLMAMRPDRDSLLDDAGEAAILAAAITAGIELVALGAWGIVFLGNVIARAS